jgi:hypothetical protein
MQPMRRWIPADLALPRRRRPDRPRARFFTGGVVLGLILGAAVGAVSLRSHLQAVPSALSRARTLAGRLMETRNHEESVILTQDAGDGVRPALTEYQSARPQ